MVDIKCIYNGSDSLGESPLWDPNQQKLFWIDINNCLIHCLDPSSQTIQTWKCPSKIGFIVRAKKGRLIAGLREGFFYFSPITGMFEKIFDPEPEKEKNRLNDGKVDRKGRLWCGSMQDPNPDRSSGALYRFTEGGTCTRVLNEIQVPNSIAWSPDNLTMYFSDTREEVIWSFDVTLKTGDISNKQIFVNLKNEIGRPDGATVDREGYLWSAQYGGGRVVRYSPDGKMDMKLALPVTNVTCCTFGGPEYKTLYVTTAKQNLTVEEINKQPLAGGVFALELNIKGLPETIFNTAF